MSIRSLSALALFTLVPSAAFAHIEITSPVPRVQADNIKEANAPCGGPRGATVHQLTGGEMFTLEFDETIAHPGHFELRFSMAGDTDWQTLDGNIADQGGVGSYSHTFEVPTVECTDCTIQFIQVMTDRNPPTNYYSCIDVAISADGLPADMGSTGTEDMGSTETPDMAAPPNNTNPPANNTNPPANNTNPPANNTNPPASNNTSGVETDAGGEPNSVNASGDACSTAPGKASTPWIFGVLGGVLIAKRRRRSSRGNTAAR